MSSGQKEVVISTGLLLVLVVLALSLFGAHIFRKLKLRWLQMPVWATCLGLVVGAVLKYATLMEQPVLQNILAMNEDVFFVMLLPPIIFEGGLVMTGAQGRHFFKNFGAILWFAFFCTTVSFCFVGASMFFAGYLNLSEPFTIRESFAFGALISSTDPVTVLAMFKDMSAHPTISALVFGESLLNDAISIVLYRTIARHDTSSVGMAILSFFLTFFNSLIIGVSIGLISALLYKYMDLHMQDNQILETALYMLFPWIAYLIADGFKHSGIVAICFCGISMGKYAFPNLSEAAQVTSKGVFAALALLAETVVFVFLGLAVSSFEHGGTIGLYMTTFVVVSTARVLSVYVTSQFVNLFRSKSKLPVNYQTAMVLCGLRGAIAFALSERARHDFGGSSGAALLSTTLFFSIFTIVIVGVALSWLLDKLDVFVKEDEASVGSGEGQDTPQGGHDTSPMGTPHLGREDGRELLTAGRRMRRLSSTAMADTLTEGRCGCFKELLLKLDERIMKPIFTHSDNRHDLPNPLLRITSRQGRRSKAGYQRVDNANRAVAVTIPSAATTPPTSASTSSSGRRVGVGGVEPQSLGKRQNDIIFEGVPVISTGAFNGASGSSSACSSSSSGVVAVGTTSISTNFGRTNVSIPSSYNNDITSPTDAVIGRRGNDRFLNRVGNWKGNPIGDDNSSSDSDVASQH
eukprot:GHVS01032226.1.p1 GENE.GHVS01032226.1~~GHVS01032226.1.p1  ORF type:complete len:757 (-),score=149.68 GHVS01032226.1:299-2365(-)